jgi:hypothetical protein
MTSLPSFYGYRDKNEGNDYKTNLMSSNLKFIYLGTTLIDKNYMQ